MEIVVHGTNGGFRTLYNTQNAPRIGNEIRNNVESKTSLGKSVYAIDFVTNGCVFRKYKIVKDALRNNATGFIAFSVFLPSDERLSGVDIKSILDKLQSHYVDNYIINNQMNRGERTQIIQEDWTFVADILSKYNTLQDHSINQLQPGTKEAAFIYYKNDDELIEYLDKPFQEEYCEYKQVLLIDSELRLNCDVLDIMRNSGIDLKNIDLKNEYYYLNNYNRSKGLTITANGMQRSDGKGNNLIRAKDKVDINYKKDDRFYFPIEANGTISNPTSEIHKYFELKRNEIIIDYAAFSNPEPKIKTVILEIRDRNGIPINDAEIKCDDNYTFKTVDNNKFTFSGEDLGKSWTVSAKKGENLFSDNQPIDFKRDCPEDIGIVKLQLNEHKKVRFSGILNNVSISDIKVTIEEKRKYEVSTEVEFINDEINKKYQVSATYHKNNEKFYGEITFCPKDSDTIRINLQLVKVEKYSIDIGKYGKENQSLPGYSNSKAGKDVESYIRPKQGWKFIGFELQEISENSGYDGKLVAQYQKNNKPIMVMALVPLVLLIVSFGVWWLWPKASIETDFLTESQIENYVYGAELNLVVLDSLKTQWDKQNIVDKKEENSIWYNPITWLKSNEPTLDSIEEGQWKKTAESIDRAIKKRNSINNFDFRLLKDSTKYSSQQLKLKYSINGIDSTQYDTIRKKFYNVRNWNLNQIADSINVFLKSKVSEIEVLNENNDVAKIKASGNPEAKGREANISKSTNKDFESINESKIQQTTNKETKNQGVNNDIKKQLQSGTITKKQLEKYEKENPVDFKSSIDIYLKFWALVKDSTQKNDFDKLLKDTKRDDTLKNSELKKFLDFVCSDSQAFQKYLELSGKATMKSINELKKKVQ
ncbi:hypothetical protein [Gelidibacter maritimus]|uniref:Uncharacterized protein n=1 Tax=Gelidibacter maritimus TaxID=2761487 RepID=A0A7W2M2L4_9FLAO|nr:hypothetical protein [Gelidibacter maritimus]MBA6151523.1 hypothetical protein [Gelidibacter maritimus]